MKKTIIALMAMAGVAMGAEYDMTAGGDLYAGAFTLSFSIEDTLSVSGAYDIVGAYYQVNNGNGYTVNAFQLNSNGTLTLNRGKSLTLTGGAITNDSALTTQDFSTFTANGEAYILGAGNYVIEYLGGTNDEAAADLYLNDVKVASFTGGKHNMNGAQSGGLALDLLTNDSYSAIQGKPVTPSIPEPTTATLSLLALAGLAARRRRR